ncbi:MAG: hypothetical protein ACLFRG_16285 [Desulfococcaceae bacterium]
MRLSLLFPAILLTGLIGIALPPAVAAQTPVPCDSVNDPFHRLHPDRWDEVLLLSPLPGSVRAENGRLLLETTDHDPHEIQVYSLFTLSGDFDIQVDYNVPAENPSLTPCRFNGGLVVQTVDDRLGYKAYVSSKPDRRLLFRGRLDRFGEDNLEKYQIRPAPDTGVLRLTRRDGRIVFRAWVDGEWDVVYPFRERCREELRVRFKLQTGGKTETPQACPVTLALDNFKVNHCGKLVMK